MLPIRKGPGMVVLGLLVLLTGALLWSPGLGFAAFPQVGSTATSSNCTSVNDDPITMPSGIVAGDLLIVIHSTDVSGATRTWSGGFTEIKDLDSSSNIGVAYKIAAGGDTLTVTKSLAERFSAIALRITASNSGGTPGADGGGSFRWASIFAMSSSRG